MKTADDPAIRRATGTCIRILRKRAGLPQEGLAALSGVDRGYMSGLECGKHAPTMITIYKLLPHLVVDIVGFAEELNRCVKRRQRRKPQPVTAQVQRG
jgi:transcriptional regulator with XRE-family HTH domain